MTVKKRFLAFIVEKKATLSLLIFIISTILLLVYGNVVKKSIIFGIKLSVLSVIPSVFPFFILSDFLSAYYTADEGLFSRAFEKVFCISKKASGAFIIGSLCGFPLGVKYAAEMYNRGEITRDECERLCSFTNNPSLAFVVSGVGLGMLGSLKYGILLYLTVLFSSIITGFFMRHKVEKIGFSIENPKQSFNLSISIKNSAYSSLTISSYIIFFSAIIGILSESISSEVLLAFLSPFFEVGNASELISSCNAISISQKFSLLAFALSFSGLSVFMQSISFLPSEISKKRLLISKLFQGLIALLISLLMYRI